MAEVITKGLSELKKFELEMRERQEKDSWVWGPTAGHVVVPLTKIRRLWEGRGRAEVWVTATHPSARPPDNLP